MLIIFLLSAESIKEIIEFKSKEDTEVEAVAAAAPSDALSSDTQFLSIIDEFKMKISDQIITFRVSQPAISLGTFT